MSFVSTGAVAQAVDSPAQPSSANTDVLTESNPKTPSYRLTDFGDDMRAISWEVAGTAAAMTAIGVKSWDWGSQNTFKMNSEGWFGSQTGSGGSDKLGHAFTSYAIANVFSEQLERRGRDPARAATSGFLASQAIMLYVEVFDGYSKDHGFSKEDLAMNLLGGGFSALRTLNPKVKEMVDFRMEYKPSGYKGFRPFSDYAGQKYLLALKLQGLPSLKSTPLRFLELHAGYYARGFTRDERVEGFNKARRGYVGVGLNLSSLLWPEQNESLGSKSVDASNVERYGKLFLSHFQIPYTSVNADGKAR